jgi:hypothetical protein
LELRSLFESPTIAGVAAIIEQPQSHEDMEAESGIEGMLGDMSNVEHLLAELNQLSEAEAERMLNENESLLKRLIDAR